MNTRTTTILAIAFVAVSAFSQFALAGGQQGQIEDLQREKQKLQGAALSTKGYPRSRLDQERLRLGNLIDDLEQGRHVDPSEIDRALERAGDVERTAH
jgi:hypothetical protein